MEWILVLVFIAYGPSQPGGTQLQTATIPGHRSKEACLATLEATKREAESHFGLTPEQAREMFRRSFCIPKVPK